MGISFGGYLAPRAVSADRRLAACIADPGEFSLWEELQSRVPTFITRELPAGSSAVLSFANLMLRRRIRHATRGWGLRRGCGCMASGLRWTTCVCSKNIASKAADRIRCPTLVCSAENDEVGATARKLYEAMTCEKEFIAFTVKEGAGKYCEAGARTLFTSISAASTGWTES
jgi:hypothetical protein